MMRLILSTAAAALIAGSALAQGTETKQPQTPSSVDKGAAPTAEDKATAPKTTGALNKESGSLATSPQDVQAQQQGEKTAAEGGGHREGAPAPDPKQTGQKTTGAAPGGDYRK
jgi:hypothetical protein